MQHCVKQVRRFRQWCLQSGIQIRNFNSTYVNHQRLERAETLQPGFAASCDHKRLKIWDALEAAKTIIIPRDGQTRASLAKRKRAKLVHDPPVPALASASSSSSSSFPSSSSTFSFGALPSLSSLSSSSSSPSSSSFSAEGSCAGASPCTPASSLSASSQGLRLRSGPSRAAIRGPLFRSAVHPVRWVDGDGRMVNLCELFRAKRLNVLKLYQLLKVFRALDMRMPTGSKKDDYVQELARYVNDCTTCGIPRTLLPLSSCASACAASCASHVSGTSASREQRDPLTDRVTKHATSSLGDYRPSSSSSKSVPLFRESSSSLTPCWPAYPGFSYPASSSSLDLQSASRSSWSWISSLASLPPGFSPSPASSASDSAAASSALLEPSQSLSPCSWSSSSLASSSSSSSSAFSPLWT